MEQFTIYPSIVMYKDINNIEQVNCIIILIVKKLSTNEYWSMFRWNSNDSYLELELSDIYLNKIKLRGLNNASIMFLNKISFSEINELKYVKGNEIKVILNYIKLEKRIYVDDDIDKNKTDVLFKQILNVINKKDQIQ